MSAHHDWCDPQRCSTSVHPTVAGAHKGHIISVQRPDGSTLTTTWIEQVHGGPPLLALGQYRLTADEADAVVDAVREVAQRLRALR